MMQPPPDLPAAGRVRALFISDMHLGARLCRGEALAAFLAGCDAERIYLVGDIIDGWRLKARWHWPRAHDAIVRSLLEKQQEGARITYIPGNHDEFLRGTLGLRLGGIEVVDEAEHTAADGTRYLVVHGDRFDPVVRRMRMLAALGIWVYAAGVLAHDAVDRRLRTWRGARADDRDFARAATGEARARGFDGVICGHTHIPGIRTVDGVRYLNTGDWVHACTAVVEHADGRMELLRWPQRETVPQAGALALGAGLRPAAG